MAAARNCRWVTRPPPPRGRDGIRPRQRTRWWPPPKRAGRWRRAGGGWTGGQLGRAHVGRGRPAGRVAPARGSADRPGRGAAASRAGDHNDVEYGLGTALFTRGPRRAMTAGRFQTGMVRSTRRPPGRLHGRSEGEARLHRPSRAGQAPETSHGDEHVAIAVRADREGPLRSPPHRPRWATGPTDTGTNSPRHRRQPRHGLAGAPRADARRRDGRGPGSAPP